ncbi:hypothetical protein D5F01_LYC24724, partial [Scomber scombrus]
SYAAAARQRPPGGARRRDPPQPTEPDVRREPAGPQLGRLIRKLYAVIKRVHHFLNVAPKPGKQEPRVIARMIDILATMIKPAFPTQQTGDFIVGNAKNWGQITCQILAKHYERALEEQLEELKSSLTPDWKEGVAAPVRGRAKQPFPNQPAPPLAWSRYPGPQSRSYVAVARGGNPRPAPRSPPFRPGRTETGQNQTPYQPADPQFAKLLR